MPGATTTATAAAASRDADAHVCGWLQRAVYERVCRYVTSDQLPTAHALGAIQVEAQHSVVRRVLVGRPRHASLMHAFLVCRAVFLHVASLEPLHQDLLEARAGVCELAALVVLDEELQDGGAARVFELLSTEYAECNLFKVYEYKSQQSAAEPAASAVTSRSASVAASAVSTNRAATVSSAATASVSQSPSISHFTDMLGIGRLHSAPAAATSAAAATAAATAAAAAAGSLIDFESMMDGSWSEGSLSSSSSSSSSSDDTDDEYRADNHADIESDPEPTHGEFGTVNPAQQQNQLRSYASAAAAPASNLFMSPPTVTATTNIAQPFHAHSSESVFGDDLFSDAADAHLRPSMMRRRLNRARAVVSAMSKRRETVLDVAVRSRAKRFTANATVKEIVDQLWSGLLALPESPRNGSRRHSHPRQLDARQMSPSDAERNVTDDDDNQHQPLLVDTHTVASRSRHHSHRRHRHRYNRETATTAATTASPPRPQSVLTAAPPEQSSMARLKVPRNQHIISLVILVVFIAVYTITLLGRADQRFSAAEALLDVMAVGYMLEEARQFSDAGWDIYQSNPWNIFELLSSGCVVAFMAIRAYAFHVHDRVDTDSAAATTARSENMHILAFDLLSATSVLLWPRLVSAFDHQPFVGCLTIILQHMLRDALQFFVVAALIIVGFTEAFYGLGGASHDSHPLSAVVELLVRVFFGSNFYGFDEAPKFGPFGMPLMTIYISLAFLFLLNLLISIFNQSFARVTARAEMEYRFLFTVRVMEHLRGGKRKGYVFHPPVNIVYLVALRPWKWALQPATYERLSRALQQILLWPALACTVAFERYDRWDRRRRMPRGSDYAYSSGGGSGSGSGSHGANNSDRLPPASRSGSGGNSEQRGGSTTHHDSYVSPSHVSIGGSSAGSGSGSVHVGLGLPQSRLIRRSTRTGKRFASGSGLQPSVAFRDDLDVGMSLSPNVLNMRTMAGSVGEATPPSRQRIGRSTTMLYREPSVGRRQPADAAIHQRLSELEQRMERIESLLSRAVDKLDSLLSSS